MSRKSSIVVSFSWVLIAIIGVLFLVMTTKLIDKYREYQDNKFKVEFKKIVNDLFRRIGERVGVEENKLVEIDGLFSGKELEPICMNNLTILKVGNIFDTNNEIFKSNPVFLHKFKVNKHDPVFLIVQRYRLPFPVVNLFILTSRRILIVFIDPNDVGDSTYASFVSDFFKSSFGGINAMVVSLSDLNGISSKVSDENIQKVIIVTGSSSSVPLNALNFDVPTYIYSFDFLKTGSFVVTSADINVSSGGHFRVSFLDYGDDFALTKSILFTDPGFLNCSIASLYNSLRISYDFYYEKSNLICGMIDKNNCSGSTILPIEENISKICENSGLIGDIFVVEMYKNMKKTLHDINDLLNSSLDPVTFANLLSQLESSESEIEESGCVSIY